MIGLPPSAAAVKETVNELSPEAIEVIVGAEGVLAVKPEVITRLPAPLAATATNFSCPAGPPHVTESQLLSAAEVCEVQVMPSARIDDVENAGTVAMNAMSVMNCRTSSDRFLGFLLMSCTSGPLDNND